MESHVYQLGFVVAASVLFCFVIKIAHVVITVCGDIYFCIYL